MATICWLTLCTSLPITHQIPLPGDALFKPHYRQALRQMSTYRDMIQAHGCHLNAMHMLHTTAGSVLSSYASPKECCNK